MIDLDGDKKHQERSRNHAGRMPALFVGHGSPMNAIDDNRYSQTWADLGSTLRRPTSILCVSAHWYLERTLVGSQTRPKTIHDFFGFPDELYRVEYPAEGSPELAERVVGLLGKDRAKTDNSWGLDHGCWAVLRRMYPRADVPIVQLSINALEPPAWHFDLAKRFSRLRNEGVLIVGSGNIVHNLRMVRMNGRAYDWASEFDQYIHDRIVANDVEAVLSYERSPAARFAVPTNDHYLPMLYPLALREEGEPIKFFLQGIDLGSVSMTGFLIGAE